MNVIIYWFYSIFLWVVFMVSNIIGSPVAEKVEAKQYTIEGDGTCFVGDGRVSVHDPSVVQDSSGTFYVFGSHGATGKSNDLKNFENVSCGINDSNRMLVPEGSTLRQALAAPLSWTDTYQTHHFFEESRWETNIWAPDVIYNEAMGKYCYYACSSVWGTPHSVIWFGTSDSIEGPYENIRCIVYSGFDNITRGSFVPKFSTNYQFTNIPELMKKGKLSVNDVRKADWYDPDAIYDSSRYPNAIDPNVFYDEKGEMWMVYGSYSGGIYLIPLDEKSGEPDYKFMKKNEGYDIYFGKKLLSTTEANEWSGEGPYIIYDKESGYYYLYVSYCGLNSLGGYNIREYRSKSVDGPYLDAAGNSALDSVNSGVKLFGNYSFTSLDKAYLAAGHSSSLVTEDGKMFQVYHTRFNDGTEGHQVRVHQMARTAEGWATVLPFEYTGEAIDYKGIDKADLEGEYEFINHGSISNGCADWENVDKIISPTQKILLNSDGTISGLKVYQAEKENTALSSKNVSGVWEIKEGTAYVTFTIDSTVFSGVFCRQTEENSGREKIVFSAIGENNESIWGVKTNS